MSHPSMDSVYIVTGMDAIINPDNIKPGMTSQDLQALENRMIDGGMLATRTKEPHDKFQEELMATAKKYGISFGEPKAENKVSQPTPTYTQPAPTYTQPTPTYTQPAPTYTQSLADESTFDDGDSGEEEEYEESGLSANDLPANMLGYEQDIGAGYNYNYNSTSTPTNTLASYTQEQQRVARINNVIGDGVGFSLEQERKEDLKCAMLAEIDNLMDALENEDVDLSRIPKVDRKSDYADVSAVLKMLRHKNDHSRYCGFAEEFLLFGALAMEKIFDGKTTYLSRYNPDLTGWHNHVNMKVKRMRADTSQIVSSVMHDYNISPGFRILMELLPSMVLYSNMRSEQHGQVGLASDENMQAELANVNAL